MAFMLGMRAFRDTRARSAVAAPSALSSPAWNALAQNRALMLALAEMQPANPPARASMRTASLLGKQRSSGERAGTAAAQARWPAENTERGWEGKGGGGRGGTR